MSENYNTHQISNREAELVIDRRARIALAEIYGIPLKQDGEPPRFDLSNIDMGRAYIRPEAQPDCA